jgi:3-oxoacyl-[acyl-carrier protein] reductase
MDLGLKGKIALVGGASRGLGAATARELAREGATVVLAARNRDRLVQLASSIWEETGATTMVQATDLTQSEEVERLVEIAEARFGRLDILVTNSGGPPSGGFEDHDLEAWRRAVDLTLLSVVRLIKAALPALRKSEAASILTFSSNSARQPVSRLLLSNSLRLAVIGLTKSLALELGPQGIRVNSILPAWTSSERALEILTERSRRNGTTLEHEIEKQGEESVFGRLGTPEEFARAATFLCSPAVPFLTGVMLPFDGGIYKATL